MEVVLDRLDIRLQPSRARVESKHGVRVQVVAGTQLEDEIGSGVSGRHVQRAGELIERIRCPHRATGRWIFRRCFGPGRARGPGVGDGIELPDRATRRGVERIDPSGDTELVAARVADEDEVVPRERRHRYRLAFLGIADRDVPAQLSGGCIDPQHVRVSCATKQHPVAVADAAIDLEEGDRLRPGELPLLLAGRAIDRIRGVERREIECATDRDNTGLKAHGILRLKGAQLLQPGDVGCIDLVDRCVAFPVE